jgi:transposase
MGRKDRRRIVILSRVKDGQLSIREASEQLGLSYRQGKRMWKRYRDEGDAGVIHRGRGASSNNRKDEGRKEKLLGRYREVYSGFGPTLALEKLVEEDGLQAVSRETLRLWLIAEKLWEPHRRRGPYRKRREPKEHFGELVQLDGSHHEWFEGRGDKSCLMSMVDDATGTVLVQMSEEETSEAAMRILWAWIERYGIPLALYCDLKNVYVIDREPTLEEELEGKLPRTAFGLACEKLGIRIIKARSPQAKGRVERKHGVFQDRFVKELRLKGAKSIGEANLVLTGGFTEKLNRKFARPAVKPEDFHVALQPGQDLRDVFCFEERRNVSQDWVVRNDNHFYQLVAQKIRLPRPNTKVVVRRWLDGSVHILHEGRRLHYQEFDPQAKYRRKAS